jgi:pyridoxamine 5'-phosphate oxidase
VTEGDPLRRFAALLERARAARGGDATAHVVATADASGAPGARYVLLKAVDARGFVFYTNLRSRKGAELAANPRAALCFFWPWIGGVEVRVAGDVEPVPAEEADAYFRTRPRVSQIGAWASRQSAPLSTRLVLVGRVLAHACRFLGEPVVRPPFWSGFLLRPREIESLEPVAPGLVHTLHYVRSDGAWTVGGAGARV